MIEVNQLEFSPILKPILFSIGPGRTLAVIGHNGAGKTTLFHVLLKLKFNTAGSFSITERNFGYVPERPYLDPEETFHSFLKLHLQLISYPKSGFQAEIERVVASVGLQGELEKKFSQFSKGMQQKAVLAQALLGSPKLIFLDEPMSGLDPESRKELMKKLIEFKKQGISIVFSSHMMEDVEQLADQVLVLEKGSQKFFGPCDEWVRSGRSL